MSSRFLSPRSHIQEWQGDGRETKPRGGSKRQPSFRRNLVRHDARQGFQLSERVGGRHTNAFVYDSCKEVGVEVVQKKQDERRAE